MHIHTLLVMKLSIRRRTPYSYIRVASYVPEWNKTRDRIYIYIYIYIYVRTYLWECALMCYSYQGHLQHIAINVAIHAVPVVYRFGIIANLASYVAIIM